jgi:hypothetical protein
MILKTGFSQENNAKVLRNSEIAQRPGNSRRIFQQGPEDRFQKDWQFDKCGNTL